jgi:hypothetical protein
MPSNFNPENMPLANKITSAHLRAETTGGAVLLLPDLSLSLSLSLSQRAVALERVVVAENSSELLQLQGARM